MDGLDGLDGLGHRPYVQLEHRWAVLIKFSEQVDILGDSSEYLESGAYTVLVELCATLS